MTRAQSRKIYPERIHVKRLKIIGTAYQKLLVKEQEISWSSSIPKHEASSNFNNQKTQKPLNIIK